MRDMESNIGDIFYTNFFLLFKYSPFFESESLCYFEFELFFSFYGD